MAKILGVGIATVDIINYVDNFPQEDAEVRASRQTICRGGNVTNTLTVLSQLGHQCYWAGTLANESDTSRIISDLEQYHINTEYCRYYQGGKVPTSYITLNVKNGSRTIVHYRDLPELDFTAFQSIPLNEFDWVHFEARNIQATVKMLGYLKTNFPMIHCSVEFEKPRENIQLLFPYADICIFSKIFCEQSNTPEPEIFLSEFNKNYPGKTLILAWGETGAYGLSGDDPEFVAAEKVAEVTDTLGAGDTFNAGIINSLTNKLSVTPALQSANRLAAYKISRHGFDITGYEN